MLEVAKSFEGQLTATMHLDAATPNSAASCCQSWSARQAAFSPTVSRPAWKFPKPWFTAALPGLDELRRNFGRHHVDPPLHASGFLSEHSFGRSAGRHSLIKKGRRSHASPVLRLPHSLRQTARPVSSQRPTRNDRRNLPDALRALAPFIQRFRLQHLPPWTAQAQQTSLHPQRSAD